jgi:hypothetical protein
MYYCIRVVWTVIGSQGTKYVAVMYSCHQDVGGRLKMCMRKGRRHSKSRKMKKTKEEGHPPWHGERHETEGEEGELPR